MTHLLKAASVAPLIFVASVAGAQARAVASTATAATPSATVAAAVPNTEMAAALRNLITLQEKYWSEHGTYTSDGVALGTYPYAKASPVLVQVIFAGSRGWTGVATYRGLKGKSCVVFVGIESELPKIPSTQGDKTTATKEGNPVCDAPQSSAK